LFQLLGNPNPIIRVPPNAILAFALIGFGIFVISTSASAFRIDRWKPPVDDRSRIAHIRDR
jgi:hypothetical protein